MNLSAYQLSTFQRCKRRYAIERSYRTVRWHAKTLLERCLRDGIMRVSNGEDVIITSQEACARLLQEATHSGIESSTNSPYTLVRDYCSIIQTVLEAISRMVLLTIKPGGVVALGDTEHHWQLSAFRDESGSLHRWVLVDKWNDDSMYKELQSWYCFGDCAAAQVGMTLHVIEIGRQTHGHQHTDWARSFKHPAIHNKYRFRKVDGDPLEKSWTPVWYQDSERNNAKAWVDLMDADKLKLIHHVEISEPSKGHIKEFYAEVEYEAEAMLSAGDWQSLPRSRPACNLPYTCPWQSACYTPAGLVDIDKLGGYSRL